MRALGAALSLSYAALIVWLAASQPQSLAEVTGGISATVGVYRVDPVAFEDGLRFFHQDHFVEARAAFNRADSASRDARTQFYIAYSHYREGWGRVSHDDTAYAEGLKALEEGLKPTDALSGGETARLLFCRIMLQKPNVLIFDEPTNHLDLESINALNIALQKFEGTVLLVTHDQDLMEEVGTRVWHFDNGRIQDFKGAYEEYEASLK